MGIQETRLSDYLIFSSKHHEYHECEAFGESQLVRLVPGNLLAKLSDHEKDPLALWSSYQNSWNKSGCSSAFT